MEGPHLIKISSPSSFFKLSYPTFLLTIYVLLFVYVPSARRNESVKLCASNFFKPHTDNAINYPKNNPRHAPDITVLYVNASQSLKNFGGVGPPVNAF